MAFSIAMPWHKGEEKMRELMRVPDEDNPTASMLTPQAVFLLQRAPLLAVGTVDSEGRPWTTLWGGRTGFSEPLGGGIIGTRTLVDGLNDPVVQGLGGAGMKGQMVQGAQKMVSCLAIDLMARKRVKVYGRLLASSLDEVNVTSERSLDGAEGEPMAQNQLQLVTKVEQSLGNCPKYLNQYEIQPASVKPKVVEKSSMLSLAAKELIYKADMFFMSSSTTEDMDTNHRGGPAGFVRILSDTEIVYPEYSGNRFYQSLGNLYVNPKIGVVFPDYEAGDVLYITGTAKILVLTEAAKLLPGSNLAVKIKVDEARFVEGGLPFRGVKKLPSPYNPLVRTLVSEGNIKGLARGTRTSAFLVQRTIITPTVARFCFSVPDGISYTPGQWAVFDFSKEMDEGYSHMRDHDPASLNDDFVRTFTISSWPANREGAEKEFEITIRKVGPVTGFLFRVNDSGSLQVPVIGVGGDFAIQKEDEGKTACFIAAGVGITPLLGQLPLAGDKEPRSPLRLLWTVRVEDIDLVLDTVNRYPAIAHSTEIYLTAVKDSNEDGKDAVDTEVGEKMKGLQDAGLVVWKRRMNKEDVLRLKEAQIGTWYLCAGKLFRKVVLGWLEGEKVLFEDFDY